MTSGQLPFLGLSVPCVLLAVKPTPTPAVSSVIFQGSALPDFDPRRVPVVAVDSQLPAVAPATQTPQALRHRFASAPVWEPEVVLEKKFMDREPAHAAVLLAIVQREQPMVLLTERTAHLSTHSGQVAFPGGRADAQDASPAETALREAQEEVGLGREFVEVLGSLPTYVTGSSFIITPVVALVRPDCVLRPNPYEVADLFEVPLAFLLDPANHRRHVFDHDGSRREWFSMPYQDGEKNRFIWGATAGMLRNFYRFMSA
jgi:8-oxo-dGTP pyrophosphatase MutT (NUDIX family)